jgi:rhodanese-related sulfurtransferase
MHTEHGLPAISCKDLRLLQDRGEPHRVIDVRDVSEYEAGHVEGSVHVPHAELETNIVSLVGDRSRTIVVLIGEGEHDHAKDVHDRLKAMGYADVRFLLGGFDAWCKPAEPDISDVLEEGREEQALSEDRRQHGEDQDDVEQGTQDEPLL